MLKFVSYKTITNQIKPGLLLSNNNIIDLISTNIFNSDDIPSILTLINKHKEYENKLRNLVNLIPNNSIIEENKYQLITPFYKLNRNLFCVGKNYMDHVKETSNNNENVVKPKYPQFFTKVPETVIGPNEIIPSHSETTKWLDYEAELAVVIGKQGVNISIEDATNHIFGYTIANDISARDVQKRHVQFMKGKCLDRTCPLGPVIVYHKDIDPNNLKIQLWVNDELRQNSNTNQMIFNIPEIIHQLSKGMTLYPGDIILTGTPSGVGFAMNPPQVLKPNDKIRIEIEGLGVLENTIGN